MFVVPADLERTPEASFLLWLGQDQPGNPQAVAEMVAWTDFSSLAAFSVPFPSALS